MEKIAIFGNGGREAAIAISLSTAFQIYGVSEGFANETVRMLAEADEDILVVASISNERTAIVAWLKRRGIRCAIIQQDNLLADGMVDYLRKNGIKTFGATQDASRLEWDKAYAIDIMERAGLGKYLPRSATITSYHDKILEKLSLNWENTVVKPNCLTGGKGVKVGSDHFKNKQEVLSYIKSCIENDGSVVVQERIIGYEFTIMGITDGESICFCPPTYDYPYRFDGDTGPGTGGMGCIMDGTLLFLNEDDISECRNIMETVVNYMHRVKGDTFEGCINGGFFKTSSGIKFMEFNARLGDPEAHNALAYLGDAFSEQVRSALGLSDTPFNEIEPNGTCRSIVVYLVSSNYACGGAQEETSFPMAALSELPQHSVRFASAVITGSGDVKFVGQSRSVAIMLCGSDIEAMRSTILEKCASIRGICPNMDYRNDIGQISDKFIGQFPVRNNPANS